MDEAEAIKMSGLIESHTIQALVVAQYRSAFMAPLKNALLPVSPQRRPLCRLSCILKYTLPLHHCGSAIFSWRGWWAVLGVVQCRFLNKAQEGQLKKQRNIKCTNLMFLYFLKIVY